MTRAVLILLVILVAFAPAGTDSGKRQRHKDRPVVVRDYTGADHEGVIEETTEDFTPWFRLRYKDMGNRRCPKGLLSPKGTITVCSFPVLECEAHGRCGGLAYIGRGTIHLADYAGEDDAERWFGHYRWNTACHEFMHLLAATSGHIPQDFDSCLRGPALTDPGPGDMELIRLAKMRG